MVIKEDMMKKALISPEEQIGFISSWTEDNPPQAVFTTIPNSQRVAQVENQSFEVASPLFWVDCADDVVADFWYYDNAIKEILRIPPSPPYPKTAVE